ncbi:MAG: arsenosugar biosynthesis radical SAM protein ArsS [Desulfobacterales bacterium]
MTPSEQLSRLARLPGQASFGRRLAVPLTADGIGILQLNVGRRCNLACRHCHVQAGPARPELMPADIFDRCLGILQTHPIGTVDITGGAPEMNPHLEHFIRTVSVLGRRVLVRSNLAILLEQSYRHFLDIYADNGVEVVASLPDYRSARVDRQRGAGVFDRVIAVMARLNERGYGNPGSGLVLDLVTNPVGAYLPGPQAALEDEYRTRLAREHGVNFNTLFCITNCPVGRYLDYLIRSDNFEDYMSTLVNTFNRGAVEHLMCRSTLSVAWDGRLFDCDFNQMLDLTVDHGAPNHISRFDYRQLRARQIRVHNHCFSCTAGAGSSCQGALEA